MSVMKDSKIFLDGYDLSGDLNATNFDYGAEMLDSTHFGDGARVNVPGLTSARVAHEGYWRAGGAGPDDSIFARLGTPNAIISLSPETGALGETAYTFRAVHSEYSLGGAVGDLQAFSVSAEGDDGIPPARGKVLYNASATGNVTGTAVNLGATASGQTIVCALHVFSGTGAFTVVVQSAAVEGFGTPTTRFTFSTVGTGVPITAQWGTPVSGAVTHEWWRVTATNPNTRAFAVVAGII